MNDALEKLTFEELRNACRGGGVGGFLPATKQIGSVAALPGIVHRSIGLPDVHSGYGFAVGNTAAFDMSDPEAVVSPGKVTVHICRQVKHSPSETEYGCLSFSCLSFLVP